MKKSMCSTCRAPSILGKILRKFRGKKRRRPRQQTTLLYAQQAPPNVVLRDPNGASADRLQEVTRLKCLLFCDLNQVEFERQSNK